MALDAERRLAMRTGMASPPLFTVGWQDALFEHYRVVDEAPIVSRLPPGVELDRHDGAAWLSVVSFRMVDMRLGTRGPRLPLAHTYPQVNVRVYVRCRDRCGVFFLRNYVSNRLAAVSGRLLYGMPYHYQRVHTEGGDTPWCETTLPTGRHRIAGRRGPRLTGHEDDPTTLRFFLCERYPLYSRRLGITHEAQMLHEPWPLHALHVTARTHAIVDALGLTEALVPFDEVQGSPGVTVAMWFPRRALG